MPDGKLKLLVLLGPTATGKSYCGIKLAEKFNGEIISGDSMYVYKKMDIGTAKPSREELAAVTHHMVDILEPDADFSVYDFKVAAEKLIREINAKGKLPILVGGTGLYIQALLEDYSFNKVSENPELRRELESFVEEKGNEALHARLAELDPEAAKNLHPNNVRRVIRAIESVSAGEKVSDTKKGHMVYDALVLGLNMEREFLYERINQRVDLMLEAGLKEEVEKLMREGVSPKCLSMQSLGYRQMAEYLAGEYDYEKMRHEICKGTRHFAKRQLTWYRRMPYVKWFDVDRKLDYKSVLDEMSTLIEKWNAC